MAPDAAVTERLSAALRRERDAASFAPAALAALHYVGALDTPDGGVPALQELGQMIAHPEAAAGGRRAAKTG